MCSLGHPGHSDERCYTRIRKEKRELARKYWEMMKKNGEAAQLTSTQSFDTTLSTEIRTPIVPSYYDEDYAVGTQDLILVTLDTACTSHMFGNRRSYETNTSITNPRSFQDWCYPRKWRRISPYRSTTSGQRHPLTGIISKLGLCGDAIQWWIQNQVECSYCKVISADGSTLITFHRD